MPMPSKLTDELLNKIKKLAAEGYNHTKIAEITNNKRQTIDYWVKKFNIKTNKKRSKKTFESYNKFKQICEGALKDNKKIKLNKTLKDLGLHADSAQRVLKENPHLRKAIRAKKEAIKQDKTLSLEEAQSRLPDQNDEVLGFEDGKYVIRTNDGFIYRKISSKLYQGDPRGKSGAPLNIDHIRSFLKKLNYTLVEGSFTVKRKALKAVCNSCATIRQNRLANFEKQQCPVCSNNGVSKTETEISDWIKSLELGTQKYRFQEKTKGREIDIHIPSLNLGIEYCGLYWHSEQYKDRNYHYDKMKKANEYGIRLITIFEDEWINREYQVKNFLKSVMNVHEKRIFARKCEIREVDKTIGRDFLEKNHIQGTTQIKIAFGLYFEGELLGLITGNKHHRQGYNKTLVLNRLVFEDGIQIIGGASKLLKYLIKYAKDNNYNELISWSDNRWSEGNVYEKTGFTLVQELRPDYSYYTGRQGTRISKQSCKKDKLLEKGAKGTMENTEKELAESLGYYRIWDCGKKRWTIEL